MDKTDVKSALHESRERATAATAVLFVVEQMPTQSVLSPFSSSDGLSSDTLTTQAPKFICLRLTSLPRCLPK
jgi:hypothetical protein